MATRGARGGARNPSLVGRGRGGGPAGRASNASTIAVGNTSRAAHVQTVGVRRPSTATEGRPVEIFVNCYPASVPSTVIIHYDVIIPDEKKLPARVNLAIITQLQTKIAPGIFTPRVVYDGRKNIFSPKVLDFGGEDSMEFHVPFLEQEEGAGAAPATSKRSSKLFKVRLTKVAEINTEVLKRFVEGIQSADSNVLTAITALNVVVRMQPNLNFPFNVRSFFTNSETKDIGGGLVLWRGFFQSIRPATDHLLANVDISTGIFHRPGPLKDSCLRILADRPGARGHPNEQALKVSRLNGQTGLSDSNRRFMERRLVGLRLLVKTPGAPPRQRVLKALTQRGASELQFNMEGRKMTVAQYYRETKNLTLQFPDIICAEVGQGSIVPLELCIVPEGQMMRKQIPAEKIPDVLKFSTNPPNERLAKIRNASSVLAYSTSEYIQSFGLQISRDTAKIPARVLAPPSLKYGPNPNPKKMAASKAVPVNGAWNMIDRKFFQPMQVKAWALIIFDQQRVPDAQVNSMMNTFVTACKETGMVIQPTRSIVRLASSVNIPEEFMKVGKSCIAGTGAAGPQLFAIVLPDGPVANELYSRIKYFGDVWKGVPTQCMKAGKCIGGNPQYFANVALKLNVKLGGINVIPDPGSFRTLLDTTDRTMVMGADVIHPSPGSEGRPSFTAVVANIDKNIAKYVADISVQEARQEIIVDLKDMAKKIIQRYIDAQPNANPRERTPTRIIFYRDGVSEGQFQHVLDLEVAALKDACRDLGVEAKITFIVVGKRHHIRFFPGSSTNTKEFDPKSKNCLAGTVVDSKITHPLEYDFYLQSHGGLLGTSRPSHYSVLYDDNEFTPDAIQSITFTLCHLYARSTRSVSIPAPVYYADIVCSRSKNHFQASPVIGRYEESDSGGSGEPQTLQQFQEKFKKVHRSMENSMYFM
ncbi:argonaute-like protein [Coprinopsis sp. MPI-PUGE-AT-0042]|nr:argonaute-like protein [Coprinopsis sp. MPI-PUGE-AT-0042]